MLLNPLNGSVSSVNVSSMRNLSSPRAGDVKLLALLSPLSRLSQDGLTNDIYVDLPEMFKKYIDYVTKSLGISLEFYDLITERDIDKENKMIKKIQFSKNSNLYTVTFNSHGFPIETSCYEPKSNSNLLFKFSDDISPEFKDNVKLKLWKYEGINTNLTYSGDVIASVESGILDSYLYHGEGIEFDVYGNVTRSGNWYYGEFVNN